MQQQSFQVREISEVGQARRAALRAAEDAGFDADRQSDVAIVATELANNLVQHGKGGEMLVQTLPGAGGGPAEVELIAFDAGPGMGDPESCLRDGFSTAGTPGTGMGAVRRLSREFDVYSRPGKGTVVMARIGQAAEPGREPASFRWASICIPIQGEQVCGDAWHVEASGGELGVLVVDGLGHGPEAQKAAAAAVRTFESGASESPEAFLGRAHIALHGTRGAAAAALRVSREHSRLTYAGIGNISGALVSGDRRHGLISHNGTLGVQVRQMTQFAYPMPAGSTLILHSDGLQTRWSLDDYPGLLARHPAVVAAALYRDFRRGRDDTTVVVVQSRA